MGSILAVNKLKQELVSSGNKPKLILKEITFEVPQGSLTGFIGVNGSGKTTTIKTLLDFIHPTSGEIDFFGQRGLSAELKQRIGFMPERPYFYDFLTGEEFLELHWKLRGGASDSQFNERCTQTLQAVDLERGRKLRLRQFSKGMLQRIGIAQAILHKPELLILDEPMSGLDPDGRFLIKNIIRKLHSSGTTIFFSSHLLQDMEELCDRLVIIDQGNIIFEGAIQELIARRQEVFQVSWIPGQSQQPTQAEVPAETLQQKIDQLRSEKAQIIGVSPRRISLEEAFIVLRQEREQS